MGSRRIGVLGIALFATVVWWSGCAKSGDDAAQSSGGGTTERERGEDSHDAVSNDGPKLETESVDAALATKGKDLFSSKGCTACHAFGKRVTGPDLNGVTARRTREWTTQWLLHPDDMLKSNAIARELFAQYATPMPNLHLTNDEVNALIEFMKQENAPRPQ